MECILQNLHCHVDEGAQVLVCGLCSFALDPKEMKCHFGMLHNYTPSATDCRFLMENTTISDRASFTRAHGGKSIHPIKGIAVQRKAYYCKVGSCCWVFQREREVLEHIRKEHKGDKLDFAKEGFCQAIFGPSSSLTQVHPTDALVESLHPEVYKGLRTKIRSANTGEWEWRGRHK